MYIESSIIKRPILSFAGGVLKQLVPAAIRCLSLRYNITPYRH
jgi:hypothetical protein